MSSGIGGEFLQILKGIDWGSLTANDAVALRAALKEAVTKSDIWFAQLSHDFGAMPAKVEDGRPKAEAYHPREPTPVVSAAKVVTSPPRRKRGRPPKAKPGRPAATPLAVGGADAESAAGPQAARIFENSYVSKDGPRPGASLPADHPRLHLNRESSVTPEVDMSDFHQVEEAMKTGKGVKDVFQ